MEEKVLSSVACGIAVRLVFCLCAFRFGALTGASPVLLVGAAVGVSVVVVGGAAVVAVAVVVGSAVVAVGFAVSFSVTVGRVAAVDRRGCCCRRRRGRSWF